MAEPSKSQISRLPDQARQAANVSTTGPATQPTPTGATISQLRQVHKMLRYVEETSLPRVPDTDPSDDAGKREIYGILKQIMRSVDNIEDLVSAMVDRMKNTPGSADEDAPANDDRDGWATQSSETEREFTNDASDAGVYEATDDVGPQQVQDDKLDAPSAAERSAVAGAHREHAAAVIAYIKRLESALIDTLAPEDLSAREMNDVLQETLQVLKDCWPGIERGFELLESFVSSTETSTDDAQAREDEVDAREMGDWNSQEDDSDHDDAESNHPVTQRNDSFRQSLDGHIFQSLSALRRHVLEHPDDARDYMKGLARSYPKLAPMIHHHSRALAFFLLEMNFYPNDDPSAPNVLRPGGQQDVADLDMSSATIAEGMLEAAIAVLAGRRGSFRRVPEAEAGPEAGKEAMGDDTNGLGP